MKIFTIGVYGLKEEEFFNKLLANNIKMFIDVRMRRGMRGSKYSFACHRSIAADFLAEKLGLEVEHLLSNKQL